MANTYADSPMIHEGLTILDAGSRGVGLFTSQSIAAGSLLITEGPIIALLGEEKGDEIQIPSMIEQFRQLSEGDKAKYLDLRADDTKLTCRSCLAAIARQDDPGFAKTVVKIFRTNACEMGTPGGEDFRGHGVFPTYSRMNHSCTPNAFWHYDPEQNQVRINAMRDLAQGEEVCISYTYYGEELLKSREDRKKVIEFQCECHSCSAAEYQQSDARRERLSMISQGLQEAYSFEKSTEPAIVPEDEEHGVRLAQEYLKLLNDEGLNTADGLEHGYEHLAYAHTIAGHLEEAAQATQLAEASYITTGRSGARERRAGFEKQRAGFEGGKEILEENVKTAGYIEKVATENEQKA
ncbi:hypothetical protein F5Y16DRAFT_401765 [Xylariaceae sp. FL0255]|nr:hypothetical protein F5Y16DRAFT_401765 [Xylariaceae sp. FL0255]